MKQTALLEFESTAFGIVAGENEETNPGIFGKAMAQWLAEQLRLAGCSAGEVFAEDFGWCIPIESKPHSLHVVCANADEGINRWRVFAFAEGGFMARLLGKDKRVDSLTSLFAAVKQVLQAAPVVNGLREEQP